MQTSDIQIKTAYEDSGLTPEAIANDLGFQVVAVKAKLMQISSKYRKDCGQEPLDEDDLNFSNDELKEANKMIADIMRFSGREDLRFKAATYIRDDKKGRKEVVRAVQNNQFNICDSFNQQLTNAREQMNKLITLPSQNKAA